MNNTAASYFSNEFGLSTTRAGMVAALFGLMNLFARSLGGGWSGECLGSAQVSSSPSRVRIASFLAESCILSVVEAESSRNDYSHVPALAEIFIAGG